MRYRLAYNGAEHEARVVGDRLPPASIAGVLPHCRYRVELPSVPRHTGHRIRCNISLVECI